MVSPWWRFIKTWLSPDEGSLKPKRFNVDFHHNKFFTSNYFVFLFSFSLSLYIYIYIYIYIYLSLFLYIFFVFLSLYIYISTYIYIYNRSEMEGKNSCWECWIGPQDERNNWHCGKWKSRSRPTSTALVVQRIHGKQKKKWCRKKSIILRKIGVLL